jgi:hypothetical protein
MSHKETALIRKVSGTKIFMATRFTNRKNTHTLPPQICVETQSKKMTDCPRYPHTSTDI